MTKNEITTPDALLGAFVSSDEVNDDNIPANVADGLFEIARGLHAVAASVNRLGVNDADTNMGAIELLALEVSKLRASII